jgi:hypothetical protein
LRYELSSHCLCDKCSGDDCGEVAEFDPEAIRKDEQRKILDRLDKEIHIREDEMNRKAGLEDNLTTVSGYYAAAGALNWVRVVLIDGIRE